MCYFFWVHIYLKTKKMEQLLDKYIVLELGQWKCQNQHEMTNPDN